MIMPVTSPAAIWSRAPSETAKPNFWAEKICSATWRNACTHSSAMSASARCCVASHGTAYQAAMMRKTTKLRTVANAAADIRVMMLSSFTGWKAARSALSEPVERVLALREPRGGEDRRAFVSLFAAPLHRAGKAGRYVEGEFLRAGCAITRNDAIVAPLHHARAEFMPELRRVDQQKRRPRLLRLPGEQGEGRLERAIGHFGGQPAQLEDTVA